MQKFGYWGFSAAVMLMIFGFSSLNGRVINESGLGKETYQINAHFFLYILLCISYFKATKSVLKSVILTAVYGVLDEFHQLFTPMRSASIFDVVVDVFGGIVGGLILWRSDQIVPKKLRNWLIK